MVGRQVEGAYARVLKTLAWREEQEIDKLADLDLNKSPLYVTAKRQMCSEREKVDTSM